MGGKGRKRALPLPQTSMTDGPTDRQTMPLRDSKMPFQFPCYLTKFTKKILSFFKVDNATVSSEIINDPDEQPSAERGVDPDFTLPDVKQKRIPETIKLTLKQRDWIKCSRCCRLG